MAELIPLQWGSVDFEERRIVVESNYSKNHRRRAVPMTTVLYRAMCVHLERSSARQPDDHVFVSRRGTPYKSVRTVFATAKRRAGLGPDVGLHSLRHTWAAELVRAGVDLETLRRLGGWSDYKMVQRYSHVSDDHLRTSIEKIVPKSGKVYVPIPSLVKKRVKG